MFYICMIFFVKGSGAGSSKIGFHDFERKANSLSMNDDGDILNQRILKSNLPNYLYKYVSLLTSLLTPIK